MLSFSLPISQTSTERADERRPNTGKIPTTGSWVVGGRSTGDPTILTESDEGGRGNPKHEILGEKQWL